MIKIVAVLRCIAGDGCMKAAVIVANADKLCIELRQETNIIIAQSAATDLAGTGYTKR